jgi:MprA protease rhombosortase-interaction domain-containing protein
MVANKAIAGRGLNTYQRPEAPTGLKNFGTFDAAFAPVVSRTLLIIGLASFGLRRRHLPLGDQAP